MREQKQGAIGLECELAAQSAEHHPVFDLSQSGRSAVWRPACLAAWALAQVRMRSNWRLVALRLETSARLCVRDAVVFMVAVVAGGQP